MGIITEFPGSGSTNEPTPDPTLTAEPTLNPTPEDTGGLGCGICEGYSTYPLTEPAKSPFIKYLPNKM